MIKKDLRSYVSHDKDFQSAFNLENSLKKIKEFDEIDLYSKNGFKEASTRAKNAGILIHIDIGAGSGWLIQKTAPHFKRVIAVEPSKYGLEIAKEVNKHSNNIEYLGVDMVEAMESLKFYEPVFITTAIVLSHIKDYYVKEFLKLLNELPDNSALYFHEPYGSNVQQKLWYIRSEEWWAENLDEWQLEFKDLRGPYHYGIFGIKVGKLNRKHLYRMTERQRVIWFLGGMANKFKRILRAMGRI